MPLVNQQMWDANGTLILDEWIEVPYPALTGHQVVAALNAALGIWALDDAANVAGVEPENLVAEVQAWAVAKVLNAIPD